MAHSPNTRTVKVYDMATGALLRVTTSAGEARRASELPTAGWTITDWQAGKAPTVAQVKARTAKALRNAERLDLMEVAQDDNDTVAALVARHGVYAEVNSDWQAGYDY